jgi:ribosomal protein S18 acetylase RimI-like enzyme
MIEYRPATFSDADAVAALHARSWRENYRGIVLDAYLDEGLLEERLQVWHDRLDHPPGHQFVLLAVDGVNLVGFVCAFGAHDPQWGSLVDNLHVVRDCKRNGIGSALMRQAAGWLAHSYPGLGIYLWVLEANAPARRFYERIGGENVGVSVMDVHGTANVHCCRYMWARAEVLSWFCGAAK